MKNLKKLLAVIIVVAMMATIMVPAFADAEISQDAQTCANLGLLVGENEDGVTSDYLVKETVRIQAAIIFLRLLGKLDEALSFEGEENFTDADEVKWQEGRNILAYLKANPDLGWVGNPDGSFDPQEKATPQMIYKVILEALGYKAGEGEGFDFNWNGTLEFAADKGLTKIADVENITNDDLATAIVEGLKAEIKEGGKTLAEKLVELEVINKDQAIEEGLIEDEVKILSVSPIGAKKIEVKFNRDVDTTKAVIEVKRGSVKPSVKSITFAEDKKSAVIEFNTAMAVGDYTVTVLGLTETPLTGATKVTEAERLATIEFLSDIAVISGNNITTNVVAKNQYGEDVTSKLGGATISATTSKGTSASVSSQGVLTVYGTPGLFNVDDKIVVTIVDSATGVVVTRTLTVAQAANVKSIEFGSITTDDASLKDKEINITAMTTNADKYYLPITIKDQYGNVLKAANCTGVSILSSNSHIIKIANPAIVDTDNGTVVKFQTADTPATYGTVVITAVAAATGVSANTSINVLDNAKIDTVLLETPSTELKINKAAALPVTVIDTYGKEVAIKDLTTTLENGNATLKLNTNTTLTATNGTFSISRDYVKDVATIMLTPTGKNVILTVTTATGKYQSLTLTANDAPVVTAIKGVSSSFVTMLANDTSLTTRLDDKVEFLDQYGEAIAAPAFDATDATAALDFTIKEKDASNGVTTYSSGVITASTTAGTETYEIILKDASNNVLDTKEVTVTVVDTTKITAFGIDDLNKFYTETDAATTHAQQIKIHGLVDGKKVVVNQNLAKHFSASNGLLGINSSTGKFTPTDVDTAGKDVASIITVVVDNGATTYVATKEVTYSNVAPKATSLVAKYDGTEITGGAVQVPIAQLDNKSILPSGGDQSKLQFVAIDQYGVQRNVSAYNVVVTNQGTAGTISTTGVCSRFVPGDAGKSLQVNVFIDGLYQPLKVIVE